MSEEKRALLAQIRAVTKDMVGVIQAGENDLQALAPLLIQRQELMDRVDSLNEASDKKENPDAIRLLLQEILEMDKALQQALQTRRDEARRVLEQVQSERKSLAYVKQTSRRTGGLVNDRG